MAKIRLEKSRVIVGPATIMSWKTEILDDGILKEADGQLSYLASAVLPDGKELNLFCTEAFTKDGQERIPFTNSNQVKVGSKVQILRIHFGEDVYENFLIV